MTKRGYAYYLENGFIRAASHALPSDAAHAARTLADACWTHETDQGIPRKLAPSLSALADRMDLADAARICARSARVLFDSLAKGSTQIHGRTLAWGFSSLTEGMDPSEAMRISVSAIERETDPTSPHWQTYESWGPR